MSTWWQWQQGLRAFPSVSGNDAVTDPIWTWLHNLNCWHPQQRGFLSLKKDFPEAKVLVCFGQQVIWNIDFPFLVNCLCTRKHSEVILMRNSTTEVQVQYMQGRNQISWSTQQFHDPPDEIIISAVGSRWHHSHPTLHCNHAWVDQGTWDPCCMWSWKP